MEDRVFFDNKNGDFLKSGTHFFPSRVILVLSLRSKVTIFTSKWAKKG